MGCKEHHEIHVHMETDGHCQVYSAEARKKQVDLITGKDRCGCSRWESEPQK